MTTDQIIITLRVLGRFKKYKEACEEAICILGRQLVEEGNADSEENELSMQLNIGESKKAWRTEMTNQEAKRYILDNYFDGDDDVKAVLGGDDETLAMVKAVEALEKQIPKNSKDLYMCKSCKYWMDWKEGNSNEANICEKLQIWTDPDFYCGYAEKR